MRKTLRFLRALTAINLRASFALRGSFWMQVVFMLMNNLIFFVMWWIFFGKFEHVRGWTLQDMAAIYGVGAGGFGLAVIFGEGARHLSNMIQEGDLDTFLSQPKPPLMQCVASRSWPSGWGDVATAIVLFAISGYTSPLSIVMMFVACTCAGLVFTATNVLIHSIAFWLNNVEALARQAADFMVLFSVYPKTIFTGSVRILLFTVIPAGFISFLPVELVRDFSWTVLAFSLAGPVIYGTLAVLVFRAGLRRYESGNRFGVRA